MNIGSATDRRALDHFLLDSIFDHQSGINGLLRDLTIQNRLSKITVIKYLLGTPEKLNGLQYIGKQNFATDKEK